MKLPTLQNLLDHAPSLATGLVVGYSLTKGFVISGASQVIFTLLGNFSLLAAVGLTLITLLRIRTRLVNVLITLLLMAQAIFVFGIGYIEYEYFTARYALYLIQMLIILISVFSQHFSTRVFTAVVIGFYLLAAAVLLSTGASVTQAYDSGSLVSTDTDSLNNYQALAHVFGVTATIFAIVAFSRGDKGWLRIWLGAVAIVFLILTFYSGGRGELIGSVIVVLVTISRSHLLTKMATLLGVIAILSHSDILYELQQSAGYNRILYAIENRDTGMRAQLFTEALNQYGSGNAAELFLGQGVNAFQRFHDYSWGFYPHNFLIETLLTSGLFMFMFYFMLYANITLGLFSKVAKRSLWNSLFFGIGCNYLVLTMKSGTISGSIAGIAFLFVAWFRPEMRSFSIKRDVPSGATARSST